MEGFVQTIRLTRASKATIITKDFMLFPNTHPLNHSTVLQTISSYISVGFIA
jgi:hypothetical protein